MAEMSGTKPKSADKGRLMGINIELKGNGFEVTKRYEPVMDKKRDYPIYQPEKVADSMVFETWDAAKTYLDTCIAERDGKKES